MVSAPLQAPRLETVMPSVALWLFIRTSFCAHSTLSIQLGLIVSRTVGTLRLNDTPQVARPGLEELGLAPPAETGLSESGD